LAELAQLAGRARSTIQVWLDDFTASGVARLLERIPAAVARIAELADAPDSGFPKQALPRLSTHFSKFHRNAVSVTHLPRMPLPDRNLPCRRIH
jgi:hypothetical protein